jgi:hypothetical protein
MTPRRRRRDRGIEPVIDAETSRRLGERASQIGDVRVLRAQQAAIDDEATRKQRLSRDLAHLYLRDIYVDDKLDVPAKLLEMTGEHEGVWRRVRDGMLPPRRDILDQKSFREVRVRSTTAEALLRRDRPVSSSA